MIEQMVYDYASHFHLDPEIVYNKNIFDIIEFYGLKALEGKREEWLIKRNKN